MKKKTKPTATRASLPTLKHEDWDFSQCPEDHLEACYYYEFARESAAVIKREQKFRKALKQARKALEVEDEQVRVPTIYLFHEQCPEFPDTPFLCIPKVERDRRIAALFRPSSLVQADLFTLFSSRKGSIPHGKAQLYSQGLIAAFYINWG